MTEIDTSTEAVEALLKNVTPGPLVVRVDRNGVRRVFSEKTETQVATASVFASWMPLDEKREAHRIADANARFISASRELVPALLAERDQLRDELDAAYAIIAAERGEVIKLREALSKKAQANDH